MKKPKQPLLNIELINMSNLDKIIASTPLPPENSSVMRMTDYDGQLIVARHGGTPRMFAYDDNHPPMALMCDAFTKKCEWTYVGEHLEQEMRHAESDLPKVECGFCQQQSLLDQDYNFEQY